MLVYFDQNGVLKEQLDSYGNFPRVGSQYFKIFAYFEGLDLSTDYPAAYLCLQRPDLNDSSYPALFMVQAKLYYDPEDADGSSAYFRAGGGPNPDGSYPCYLFDFASIVNNMGTASTSDDSIVTLLDTPGQWLATITLIKAGTGTTNVVGTISFNVEGEELEEETQLDYEIHNFAIALAQKLNANSPHYVRECDNFATAASSGTLSMSVFGMAGTIVFDSVAESFYRIETVTETENDEEHCTVTYTEVVNLTDKPAYEETFYVSGTKAAVEEDLSDFANGQLFFISGENAFYRKNGNLLQKYDMLNISNYAEVEDHDYVIPPEDR